MKSMTVIFNILFLININSQWQTYYPAGRNTSLYEICAVNQNLIWAIGAYGTIVKSTNGGLSWTTYRLTDTTYTILGISAINEQIAWITADDGRRLFKTTTGGASWSQQYFTTNGIYPVKFFNSNTGFFIDHRDNPYPDTARMMITRDGGATWHKNIYSPLTTILVNIPLGAVDTNFIWLVDDNKCYTLSGGLNNQWQMHIVDTGNTYLLGSSFVNSLTGYVCTSISNFKIYKTINGGINWSVYSTDSSLGANTICFIPNTNMAFVNGFSKIRISRDNGISWIHRVNYNYPTDSISMMFMNAYDTNSVWIAVNKGRLFKYNFNFIGIQSVGTELPVDFKLYQNYPNPFNPVTNIRFALPVGSDFRIQVFDILGREVYSVSDSKPAGEYVFKFDGSSLSSGIYFYKITVRQAGSSTGKFSETKKMLLIK
jgi:photosystem II stability/assembly factor-like uncharacterized protein